MVPPLPFAELEEIKERLATDEVTLGEKEEELKELEVDNEAQIAAECAVRPSEEEPVIYILDSLWTHTVIVNPDLTPLTKKQHEEKCDQFNKKLTQLLIDESSETLDREHSYDYSKLTDEQREEIMKQEDSAKLPFRYFFPQITHQTNGYDCAIFVILYFKRWFDEGRPKMDTEPEKLKEWLVPWDVYEMR